VVKFGGHAYSQEELVAEMGAAFLCAVTGIEQVTLENSAAYINGWRKVIGDDPKLVVHAAAQAQKAADFILGRTFGVEASDSAG
jgi:antirestriction protein ArdC